MSLAETVKSALNKTMSAVLSRPVLSRRNGRPEPLENGARLTAPEFMRRYEAMPHVKKAELIEGQVYMPSPVRTDSHGEPDALVQGWPVSYACDTPGVKASDNSTVQLDVDNVVRSALP